MPNPRNNNRKTKQSHRPKKQNENYQIVGYPCLYAAQYFYEGFQSWVSSFEGFPLLVEQADQGKEAFEELDYHGRYSL